jgi:PH (Pleckstrin Homology) domain-containing protein
VRPQELRPKKYRYNAAITIAAVVAFFGTVPLATSRGYLLPLVLIPLLIGVWGWRAGTDIGPAGLRVRALFGSRLVPWSHVSALVPTDRGRAYAVLTTGRRLRLPAVGAAELAAVTRPTEDADHEDTDHEDAHHEDTDHENAHHEDADHAADAAETAESDKENAAQ